MKIERTKHRTLKTTKRRYQNGKEERKEKKSQQELMREK